MAIAVGSCTPSDLSPAATSGLSLTGMTPVPSTFALPTVAVGGCRGVMLNGTLRGDPADPRVAWLVQSGQRVDVVFPAGYTARFSPTIEILDATGRVVARDNDMIGGACSRGTEPPLVLWWPPGPSPT
ncbi:MAG TPA: hypothetical protein VF494_11135 [Candidatus Limnocylindrales bacterium]